MSLVFFFEWSNNGSSVCGVCDEATMVRLAVRKRERIHVFITYFSPLHTFIFACANERAIRSRALAVLIFYLYKRLALVPKEWACAGTKAKTADEGNRHCECIGDSDFVSNNLCLFSLLFCPTAAKIKREDNNDKSLVLLVSSWCVCLHPCHYY